FHGDWWLAVSWGATPILAAYVAAAEELTWEALLAAAFGVLLIVAQRRLSTPVPAVRRAMPEVEGAGRAALGSGRDARRQATAGPVVCLALALVILRAT